MSPSPASQSLFNTHRSFSLASGKTGTLYSLPALEAAGVGRISRACVIDGARSIVWEQRITYPDAAP